MSTGGPTWDTAGALTLGAGNTFDPADATEGGDFGLLDAAWWVFTTTAEVTSLTVSTFLAVLYSGATYADRVMVDVDDFDGDATVYRLPAGTYHYLVGHFGAAPPAYTVTYARTPLIERHTAWNDELVDDPDNVLVISSGPSEFPRDLQSTQVAVDFRDSKPFYYSVLDGSMPGRLGQSKITEAFPSYSNTPGTENPAGSPHGSGSGNTGADDCAFSHALNGDQDTGASEFVGQYWNTDTYDGTLGGPPTCRPLGTGDAETVGNTEGGYRYYSRHVSDLFVGDYVQATDGMGARALWIGRLLGDLQDFYGNEDYHLGTLPYPERPVGVPDDAVLEFESELELTSVKGTADRVNRSDYTGLPVSFYVDDPVLPDYSGGWTPWQKGAVGAATFTGYGNETTPSLYDFGINSWADANDPDEGIPDAVIGTGVDVTERPTLAVGDYSIGADSGLAVIIGFNSPRYRWTWTEELPATRPSPVRVIGRKNDGLTRSGTQTIRRNTAQRSIRTLGAQR